MASRAAPPVPLLSSPSPPSNCLVSPFKPNQTKKEKKTKEGKTKKQKQKRTKIYPRNNERKSRSLAPTTFFAFVCHQSIASYFFEQNLKRSIRKPNQKYKKKTRNNGNTTSNENKKVRSLLPLFCCFFYSLSSFHSAPFWVCSTMVFLLLKITR